MPTFIRSNAATLPGLGWLTFFSSGFGPDQGSGFGQTPGYGQGGGVNPYAHPPGMGGPAPKKSNTWLWILGIVGIGGLLLCGCCGGGTFFLYSFGSGVMTEELKKEVAGDPNVEQHLGEIESLSIDLIASSEETNKRGAGKQVLVINAKGSKGDGKFIVEQSPNPQPGAMFDKIDLRPSTGDDISIR